MTRIPFSPLACLAAVLAVGGAAAADPPEPLLALTFDDGLIASGQISPPVEPIDYAEGEGPLLLPGPWGDCLDLTGAPRFGGTLDEMDPAGGALIISDPRIDALDTFAVTLWVRPAGGGQAVNARALTKMGSWELNCSRGRFSFLVVNGEEKKGYALPPPRAVDAWTFVSIVVDSITAKMRLRLGDLSSGLGEPVVHELARGPDLTEGELQIGTFNGVRPFRGKLDSLRIFDGALTDEGMASIFERDRAARGSASIYTCALPSMPARRFQLKPSDIVFSSRWQSRRKEEALELLRAYHVDHLLWVYGNSPDYIRDVHDIGVTHEGTLNGLCGWDRATPDPSGAGDTSGRQQDFDGNKVVLSHMRKWSPEHPRWTGNHNSPAFRELFFAEVDALVAAGIDALHIDDWEMAVATAAAGLSGFSPETLTGFRAHLAENLTDEERGQLGIADPATFDYRAYLRERHGIENQEQYRRAYRDLPTTPHFLDFQRRSLRDFYGSLRQHLDGASPDKYIPVSVNSQFCRRTREGGLRGLHCVDVLDFFVGEASRSMQAARQYVMACLCAEAVGIPQVMMSKPVILGHSQAALATSYALGAPFRVPWDLYMDNDSAGQPAPRYYGDLETWRPFYDVVHEHPQLFDNYVPAATIGVLLNADEPCYDALIDLCGRLAEQQAPFGLIAAASRYGRIPVSRARLESVRYVIALSPIETFSDEDRGVIDAVRASRKVRFLQPSDDLLDLLRATGRTPVRVEGPLDVYAFLRVKPAPERGAVIHVVNWNAFPGDAENPVGSGSEVFENVTITLLDPSRWGQLPSVKYYQPGGAEAVTIQPEVHPDSLRITLPRIGTWGILEVEPVGD